MQITETAAIITGGASGLGEGTARHFRTNGAKVTLLDRDATRGAEVAAEIGAGFVETDVTDETSVKSAIAQAKQEMGAITAAINCAGIATGEKTLGRDGPHSLDGFRRTVDINLIGSFNVARLAAEEIAQNIAAWEGLAAFDKPFLTLFGEDDPVLGANAPELYERIVGAKGQPHGTLSRCGHFCQEDRPVELAQGVIEMAKAAGVLN